MDSLRHRSLLAVTCVGIGWFGCSEAVTTQPESVVQPASPVPALVPTPSASTVRVTPPASSAASAVSNDNTKPTPSAPNRAPKPNRSPLKLPPAPTMHAAAACRPFPFRPPAEVWNHRPKNPAISAIFKRDADKLSSAGHRHCRVAVNDGYLFTNACSTAYVTANGNGRAGPNHSWTYRPVAAGLAAIPNTSLVAGPVQPVLCESGKNPKAPSEDCVGSVVPLPSALTLEFGGTDSGLTRPYAKLKPESLGCSPVVRRWLARKNQKLPTQPAPIGFSEIVDHPERGAAPMALYEFRPLVFYPSSTRHRATTRVLNRWVATTMRRLSAPGWEVAFNCAVEWSTRQFLSGACPGVGATNAFNAVVGASRLVNLTDVWAESNGRAKQLVSSACEKKLSDDPHLQDSEKKTLLLAFRSRMKSDDIAFRLHHQNVDFFVQAGELPVVTCSVSHKALGFDVQSLRQKLLKSK